MSESVMARVRQALAAAALHGYPWLSVEELCLGLWDEATPRRTNTVHVALHRLAAQGLVQKVPVKYALHPDAPELVGTLKV